jgi:gliding motility-associated-like protein
MKTYLRFLFLGLLIINCFVAKAQVPTNADCLGAIPICQSVYSFNSSVHGIGSYADIPIMGATSTNFCPNSCISAGESNSTWFIFTTQTAGLVNFTITPNNGGDDYDWAVYNMTTNGCSDIYNGGMQVSCNYCLNTGPTGPNGASASDCEGPNGCTQFNAPIPVGANETYVLMIDNFSASNFGYTLDFNASSAQIFDNVPPQMTTLLTPIACDASTLDITFSENILCNTISPGDFTVTGPGGPYTVTNVSGAGCNVGGTFENSFTLTVVPNMSTGGSYSINLVNTAGSVSDQCGNIAPPASLNFNIVGPNVTVSPINPSICSPGSVILTAAGATTYNWSPAGGLSGTTGVSVTASPAATTTYTVQGVTGGCSGTATTTVNITSGPVLTITPTPAGPVCAGTVVTLDVTSTIVGTTYQWSTGPTGSQITPTVNATTSYTVTGTAGGCSNSEDITITVSPNPTITVSPANPTICNSTSTTLTASGATNYTWSPPTGLSGTTGSVVTANPTNTTTYTVVGDNGGCSGSTTTTVTVNPMPTATVTGSGNICNGASVTITITLTGTGPWNLTWTDGVTPVTVNGIATSPYTFTTTTSGIYTVTAVSDANCPGSANGAAVVNIFPLPTVTLPVLASVCVDAPVYALSGGTPAGGTYSGLGVAGNNFTASIAGTGTHNIIYTYTDGNGCTNSDTNTITVNALPVVNLPVFASTCLNTPAFALSGGTPAGGTYSGPGVSSNNFDPSIAGVGVHNIVYSYTDGNSCTNTATNTITVLALPVVTFAALADVCINTASFPLSGGNPAGGTYSGTGVNGSNFDPALSGVGTFNVTYTYTDPAAGCTNSAVQPQVVNALPIVTLQPFGDICVSTPSFLLTGGNPTGGTYSGPGVVANIFDPLTAGVGTHVITYTYTDPNTNCTNTADTTINVILNINISITPNSTFICAGSSVTLSAQGANSFSWNPSTGLTSTVGSAVIATPPTTITYTVTGSNADGCSGTATATVNIYPPVDVTFLAIPQNGCKPLSVDFIYVPTSQVEDSSWVWNFGDILSEDNTSNEQNPTHLFLEEGNYIVTLTITSINGCIHSATLPVNVYDKPTADFYWWPEVGNMENPLVNFVDASTGANYWYWNFGDPASGNENESNIAFPTHIFSDSGTYEIQLIVEANHGCADTITKYITIYPEMVIYIPNAFTPDNNQLNDIWCPSMIGVLEEGYQLDVYDRWGKRIFVSSTLGEGWDGRVNGKVAPVGVYVWVLSYRDAAGKDYKRRGQVTVVR